MFPTSSSSSENHDLLGVAQKVWDALDHLAENDPEEYKKFVSKQLKEGAEAMSIPEPVFCLRCNMNKESYLFINVCKWTRMPHPVKQDDPIPMKGGVLRHLLYKDVKRKTKHYLYDIAVNPGVLEECLKESDMEQMLTTMCLDYVEIEVKIKINRKSCKKIDVTHKGPYLDLRNSLDEQWRQCLAPDCRIDNGDSQLRRLKDKKEEEDVLPHLKLFPDNKTHNSNSKIKTTPTEEDLLTPYNPTLHPPVEGKEVNKGKLIQEVKSDTLMSYKEREGVCVCVPEHSVYITEEKGGRKVIKVTVTLTGVGGVKDVELEVSEDSLFLTAAGEYELNIHLPERVDDESTKATFNTKNSVLTVIMSCQKQK